jgi:hypothetical protein
MIQVLTFFTLSTVLFFIIKQHFGDCTLLLAEDGDGIQSPKRWLKAGQWIMSKVNNFTCLDNLKISTETRLNL